MKDLRAVLVEEISSATENDQLFSRLSTIHTIKVKIQTHQEIRSKPFCVSVGEKRFGRRSRYEHIMMSIDDRQREQQQQHSIASRRSLQQNQEDEDSSRTMIHPHHYHHHHSFAATSPAALAPPVAPVAPASSSSEFGGRDKTIALNNLGVQCLELGDQRQAFNLFHQALSNVMSNEQQQQHHHQSIGGMPQQYQHGHQMMYHHQENTGYNHHAHAHHPHNQGSSSNHHHHDHEAANNMRSIVLLQMNGGYDSSKSCFHTQGLRIDDNTNNMYFPMHPQANDAICASIIIFNLAMTLHEKALDTNQDLQVNHSHMYHQYKSKFLLKAKSLYEKCHELLFNYQVALHWLVQQPQPQQQQNQQGMSNHIHASPHYRHRTHPMIDILHMALLTNMAQLNLEMVDYEKFEMYRRQLVQYIRYVTTTCPLQSRYFPSGGNVSDIVKFMEQQTGHYLLNSNLLLTMTETAQTA